MCTTMQLGLAKLTRSRLNTSTFPYRCIARNAARRSPNEVGVGLTLTNIDRVLASSSTGAAALRRAIADSLEWWIGDDLRNYSESRP